MKFALLMSLLACGSLFADGIPVPMDQQTPYNWTCNGREGQRESLHLFVGGEVSPTLYVSNGGGTIGSRVPQNVVRALLTQKYGSIDGKSFTDTRFKRTLTFDARANGLAVKLQDGTWETVLSGCRAKFRAQP